MRANEDRKLLAESRSRKRKSKRHLKDMKTVSKRSLRQIKKSADAFGKDKPRYLATQKMVATFMKACAPLEAYSQGGELTEQDLTSIELSVAGLVTFLGTWKRKYTVFESIFRCVVTRSHSVSFATPTENLENKTIH